MKIIISYGLWVGWSITVGRFASQALVCPSLEEIRKQNWFPFVHALNSEINLESLFIFSERFLIFWNRFNAPPMQMNKLNNFTYNNLSPTIHFSQFEKITLEVHFLWSPIKDIFFIFIKFNHNLLLFLFYNIGRWKKLYQMKFLLHSFLFLLTNQL